MDQGKKEKIQSSKIRNENENITTNPTEIKRITGEYDEQLYVNKFLLTQNLPRLNHKEIENLNKHKTSKDIESVTKKLLTKENPGSNK